MKSNCRGVPTRVNLMQIHNCDLKLTDLTKACAGYIQVNKAPSTTTAAMMRPELNDTPVPVLRTAVGKSSGR